MLSGETDGCDSHPEGRKVDTRQDLFFARPAVHRHRLVAHDRMS
jgi:hypothetical protein